MYKPTNKNVSTEAILVARQTDTGATLKVGAILYDEITDGEFVLLRNDLDYSLFRDPKHLDSQFIKLSIVPMKDGDDE